MCELPGPNTPRRRKGLLAIQGGAARVRLEQITGGADLPPTFAAAQELEARFPGQVVARLDYRKHARRRLLLYTDGLLVLSYPPPPEG